MNRPRPRVAALVPFWEFWEASTDEDLRARAGSLAGIAAGVLPEVDIVESLVLSAAGSAADAARRVEASGADVLLVLQVMAVPPATTTAVLDLLPGLPVVVWGLDLREPLAATAEGYRHAEITSSGATVGTTQLVTMLVRTSRPLSLTVGRLRDEQESGAVQGSIHAAWAARRIATGTLARVGSEPAGYDCVVCDVADLSGAIGIRVVDIAPAELAQRYRRTASTAVEAVAVEVAETFDLRDDTAPTAEGLARSFRFAAALESLDDELGIDAGAINCHLPELRFSPDVGIAPCFALGRETTRGRPWACAGDMLTAVALLTTKLLGGAALYHELETIDFEGDQLVIANTGEHDLAWAGSTAAARASCERLVRRGSGLRRVRVLQSAAWPRHARRVRTQPGRARRLPLHRRRGRVRRAHVSGGRDAQCLVPLSRSRERRRLHGLGSRRREPPQPTPAPGSVSGSCASGAPGPATTAARPRATSGMPSSRWRVTSASAASGCPRSPRSSGQAYRLKTRLAVPLNSASCSAPVKSPMICQYASTTSP